MQGRIAPVIGEVAYVFTICSHHVTFSNSLNASHLPIIVSAGEGRGVDMQSV